MFRRLANFASNAISGGAHPPAQQHDEQVQQLQAMGFDATQARNALSSTNGNVQQAAELLLSGGMTQTANSEIVDLTLGGDDVDMEEVRLENAMQQSLQSEEDRMYLQAQEASVIFIQQYRSAVQNRAAEAAARRAAQSSSLLSSSSSRNKKNHVQAPSSSTTRPTTKPNHNTTATTTLSSKINPNKLTKTPKVSVSQHHPHVKVPAKFQDKTKEEQVLRCADRLKSHSLAVDTLHRALSAIQQDPSNVKFRNIDKTTRGYQRSLENAPGAEALLLAMNFHSRGEHLLVLERQWVDPALLYLGISALERVQQSVEYKQAKAKLEFVKEIQDLQQNNDEQEAIRRAEYMAKCPSEPTGGSGALMQVTIANETIRRKFDGDDVLRDVLHWIGGQCGSVLFDKILSREWCLVDINRYPIAPIDCQLNLDKTLQFIGCWPSGRLEVRPSPEEWKREGNKGQVLMGSSRGLGAAPIEAMH